MASTPGEHGAAFPPFDASTYASQLIWLALTFGALYFIVSKFALPRLANIVEGRAERIEGDLAEARRLRAESKAAGEAYEKAQADARARANAIAAEARDAVAKQAEENRKALDAELAAKLEAAEAQIASTKQAALGNVRGIATDAAAAIVERLTGAAPAPAEIEQAVDASLAR
ncbi:F0F1 ATP synthase subunit B' [Methylopila henanensis]|uniref:ATP synthase subunit b n=1 Tax=Methylopila henanensis TaxID=873516 RepID=A0ABW4K7V2_9HYPH